MLCSTDTVDPGGVHHQHSPLGSGFQVDVVDPSAGTADDAKLWGCIQDCLRHLGLAADDQSISTADFSQQLGNRRFWPISDREAGLFLEVLNPRLRKRIGDEYMHS